MLLEHVPLHEAEHGRSGFLVKHVLEIPHYAVSRELTALSPLDVLSDVQCPRLKIFAGIPAFQELWPRDIVLPRHG